jgi:hypothetical protein
MMKNLDMQEDEIFAPLTYPRAFAPSAQSVFHRNPSGRVSAFICVHLRLNRVAREALAR